MHRANLRSIIDRLPAIRHACDLDLLLFLRRHPRSMLTSERLATFVGYDRERVALSVDGLIEAGLLTRALSPAHAARMYVLELGGTQGGLLSSLLEIASTLEGRRDVLRLLAPEPGPSARGGGRGGPSLRKVA